MAATTEICRVFLALFVAFNVASGANDTMARDNNSAKFPIGQIIKSCLLEAGPSASFDVIVDVAHDARQSPFYLDREVERANSVFGRFVNGRLFTSDPFLVYEYISLFIAAIERQMDSQKLYVGIVDNNSAIYYVNATSVGIVDKPTTTTTTTTRSPNKATSILDAFFHFGNEVAGILLDSAGFSTQIPNDDDDLESPTTSDSIHLAKLARKVLESRARGLAFHLPTSKLVPTTFTIVITDGTRATRPSLYPAADSTIILDISGGWSAVTRNYLPHNVLLLEYPQDLLHFVQICRFMMCQALGGNKGHMPVF